MLKDGGVCAARVQLRQGGDELVPGCGVGGEGVPGASPAARLPQVPGAVGARGRLGVCRPDSGRDAAHPRVAAGCQEVRPPQKGARRSRPGFGRRPARLPRVRAASWTTAGKRSLAINNIF